MYLLRHPRPFRKTSGRRLFWLALRGDRWVRAAVAYELDCRGAERQELDFDLHARRAEVLRACRPSADELS